MRCSTRLYTANMHECDCSHHRWLEWADFSSAVHDQGLKAAPEHAATEHEHAHKEREQPAVPARRQRARRLAEAPLQLLL